MLESYQNKKSLRDIYVEQCELWKCRKNSYLVKLLPSVPNNYGCLTILDLNLNFVGRVGVKAILEVVRVATNLKKLGLADNFLNNESVKEICTTIDTHPSLAHLDLSRNPISHVAGKLISDYVTYNPIIQEVLLQDTLINPALIKIIERKLKEIRRPKSKPNTANSTRHPKSLLSTPPAAQISKPAADNETDTSQALNENTDANIVSGFNYSVPLPGDDDLEYVNGDDDDKENGCVVSVPLPENEELFSDNEEEEEEPPTYNDLPVRQLRSNSQSSSPKRDYPIVSFYHSKAEWSSTSKFQFLRQSAGPRKYVWIDKIASMIDNEPIALRSDLLVISRPNTQQTSQIPIEQEIINSVRNDNSAKDEQQNLNIHTPDQQDIHQQKTKPIDTVSEPEIKPSVDNQQVKPLENDIVPNQSNGKKSPLFLLHSSADPSLSGMDRLLQAYRWELIGESLETLKLPSLDLLYKSLKDGTLTDDDKDRRAIKSQSSGSRLPTSDGRNNAEDTMAPLMAILSYSERGRSSISNAPGTSSTKPESWTGLNLLREAAENDSCSVFDPTDPPSPGSIDDSCSDQFPNVDMVLKIAKSENPSQFPSLFALQSASKLSFLNLMFEATRELNIWNDCKYIQLLHEARPVPRAALAPSRALELLFVATQQLNIWDKCNYVRCLHDAHMETKPTQLDHSYLNYLSATMPNTSYMAQWRAPSARNSIFSINIHPCLDFISSLTPNSYLSQWMSTRIGDPSQNKKKSIAFRSYPALECVSSVLSPSSLLNQWMCPSQKEEHAKFFMQHTYLDYISTLMPKTSYLSSWRSPERHHSRVEKTITCLELIASVLPKTSLISNWLNPSSNKSKRPVLEYIQEISPKGSMMKQWIENKQNSKEPTKKSNDQKNNSPVIHTNQPSSQVLSPPSPKNSPMLLLRSIVSPGEHKSLNLLLNNVHEEVDLNQTTDSSSPYPFLDMVFAMPEAEEIGDGMRALMEVADESRSRPQTRDKSTMLNSVLALTPNSNQVLPGLSQLNEMGDSSTFYAMKLVSQLITKNNEGSFDSLSTVMSLINR